MILQCPICGLRFDVTRYPVGKRAACRCRFRFVIPSEQDLMTLPPLPDGPVRASDRAFAPVAGPAEASPSDAPADVAAGRMEPTGAGVDSEPELERLSPNEQVLAAVRERRYLPFPYVALRRTAEKLSLASGFDHLTCIPLLRNVDPHDYQEDTARYVLQHLSGRALLADEVGLGKTIEAGMILKELVVRGLVRKILILTPASLCTQWRDELASKFQLSFDIVKSGGDWQDTWRCISSIDTAKTARNAADVQGIKWDLLIVDEAHKLRDRRTLNWKLVNGIRKRFVLLLSATPFQNDLLELYNLITVLRPGQLFTEKEFRDRFLARGDKRQARDPDALRSLLRQVMVRNRRSDVDVKFTQRHPNVLRLDLLPEERELYEIVTSFIRSGDFGTLYGGAAGLVGMSYLKQLGSSSFSFRDSAKHNILARANESGDRSIVRRVEQIVACCDSISLNAKGERLVHLLTESDEKMLIFTSYRTTQDYLAARLDVEGIPHVTFNGSMSLEQKDRAVGAFKRDVRVLLCTEAGGEGRNLQFCSRVTNYDLPWNPMRIEQRIGRVHRLGQKHDVHVYSLTGQDTIEDYILHLLDVKINLFRLIVGEVDMILGRFKFEDKVMKLFLESRDTHEFKAKMDRLGEQLSQMRQEYEKVKDYTTGVIDALPAA